MKRFVLLDTNIVSKSIRKPLEKLERRMAFEWESGTRFMLPVIVVHELELSVLRSQNPQAARNRLEKFLEGIVEILKYEVADATISASIHARLLDQGRVIGSYDILIAAQALRSNLTLVTNNVDEFSRVEGLIWEDWTI